jgi:ribosomal protein L22
MTEKNYNPNQKENKAMKKQPKAKIVDAKPKKEDKIETENSTEEVQKVENQLEEKTENENSVENKKTKEEKNEVKKPAKKIKKEEVSVNAKSIPVSTKYAINICKFIKGKRIGDAIRDLDRVVLLKKVVPMKGEYSHQKGKGISGGSFPQRASKHFIVLLKSLAGNATNHEIEEPFIFEASANWAPAPKGKFGKVRRKRTHITLKAKEMKIKEKKGNKK